MRKHIDKIISLIENNHDDKVLELAYEAYEAFVQRFPDAIEPHIPLVNFFFFVEFYSTLDMKINKLHSLQIAEFCLKYITYNPDEENLMETDKDNVNCEEVRRSAAKW